MRISAPFVEALGELELELILRLLCIRYAGRAVYMLGLHTVHRWHMLRMSRVFRSSLLLFFLIGMLVNVY